MSDRPKGDVDILMILPEDENEGYMEEVVDKFIKHYKKFQKWGSVSVFGPEQLASVASDDYKGPAYKEGIIEHLRSMRGADRIVYIDDHSRVKDLHWKFRHPAGENDLISYRELDKHLGGNRAHVILRGYGSGEAIISPHLAKRNRNVYCSMHVNEIRSGGDNFDLSSARDPENMHYAHEVQAKNKANIGQSPQKWIGIIKPRKRTPEPLPEEGGIGEMEIEQIISEDLARF